MFEGDETIKNGGDKILRKIRYHNIKEDKYVDKFYELLHIFEFDADRKRMSVIVKDCQTSEYILFCKGADSSIFNVSSCGKASKYTNCLKSFSENGWRTLVLAYRILSEAELNQYTQLIHDANNDILNREASLVKVHALIEKNLTLVGVTAVEDKLQEDVEDTLFALRQAGIKIWVLTGDKLETAVNISNSCKHFSNQMKKFIMSNMQSKEKIHAFIEQMKKE